MIPRRVAIQVVVAAVLACSVTLARAQAQRTAALTSTDQRWIGPVEPLTSPALADTAQPQLTVQGDRMVLSWIARHGSLATLAFAERSASGWTTPKSIASGDNWLTSPSPSSPAHPSGGRDSSRPSLFVNWADVPSVRALADGSLAAHWLRKSGTATYAYDVRLAFSRDGGATWTRSLTPHHDGTQTEHGFASLFPMPGAGLGLVWLDGRAMKGGSHDGHGGAGDMSVRAAIFDPAGVQQSEMLVDDRVCECCPTAIAVTSEGAIAAFRNRTEDEVRDIYVSRFVKSGAGGSNGGWRWTEPTAVHADGWKIPACPVNGPALGADGRRVAIAWFTVQDDTGHAYVAFSDDAGRTFGAPIRVDETMSIGRVDVELLPDGSAAVTSIDTATDEKTGQPRTQVLLRRVERSGRVSPPIVVTGIGSGRTSGYPRMARSRDELVFAWTDTSVTPMRVATARARLLRASDGLKP